MTIQEFKAFAVKNLTNSQSPKLDAEVFLEFYLKLTKTQQLLHNNYEIDSQKLEELKIAVEKRAKGLPVAYITGHKEFYGYDFFVTPDVLIPKPDTEILVERAIDVILEKIQSRHGALLTVCDMCTGSGCIALSVIKTLIEDERVPAEELPKFTLADISDPALEIARKNANALLGNLGELVLSRVSFVRTNLFENIAHRFDIILTNPPYIPHTLVDELLKDGRSEPRLALDGDITISGERAFSLEGAEKNDGLEIIRNLLSQSREHLSPLGTILMETGEYNAKKAAALGERCGYKSLIHKDLEGQLRVVELN